MDQKTAMVINHRDTEAQRKAVSNDCYHGFSLCLRVSVVDDHPFRLCCM
jgi:hypothetical protein